MRERPILFSGPMVRALLSGTKTQTRRVVKIRGETPPSWATFGKESHSIAVSGTRPSGLFYWSDEQTPGEPLKTLRRWPLSKKGPMAGDHYHAPCPYGVAGDRLWVRETWAPCPDNPGKQRAIYRADSPAKYDGETWTWRPSIHMPRWASRVTLEITDVRVERLQSISDADVAAEGSRWQSRADGAEGDYIAQQPKKPIGYFTPRICYWRLWDSINASRGFGWDANPWVWVLNFKRVEVTDA